MCKFFLFQISENTSEEEQPRLISTKFIDWCSKHFAECGSPHSTHCDTESSAHFEREWRYSRVH